MSLHNAPPVVYPLGRSSFLGGLLLVVWCAGLLSVLLWYHLTGPFSWRLLAGLAAVLAAGMAAASSWKNAPTGQLVWDGEVWRWQGAREPAGLAAQEGARELAGPAAQEVAHEPASLAAQELSVIADFQRCLLLKLQNQAGASLWLWVEQRAMPARWLDLRRAVYSPRRSSGASPLHDVLAAQPALSPTSSAVPTSAVAVSTALPSMQAIPPKP